MIKAVTAPLNMSNRDKAALAILALISVFLFADQNVMMPVINEIQLEFGINEARIGVIGSAFIIIGAIVSMLFGVLADRANRKYLLVLVVLLGEIPCLMTGLPQFTQTYEQLLILRILTGLGIGGIFPLTYSLLGDYFDDRHRAMANAVVASAWGIGMMGGQMAAGFLAVDYGWRFPFILVALPNFVLVPLFVLIAREPSRGAREKELKDLIDAGVVYRERIRLSDLKYVLANKTNLLGYVQGIPGSIPWGILPFYLVIYFELIRGFNKEMATTLVTIFGIGTFAGTMLGAWLGDRIYRKNPRGLPLFCGTAVLLGIIPTLFMLNVTFPETPTLANAVLPVLFAVFTGALVALPGPNIKAMLQNVNAPEHRGTVFAVHNITDSIGRGAGPFVGGLLIVAFSYEFTVYFAALMWIPCGIIYMLMALTIMKDLDYLKRYLTGKKEKLQRSFPA